MRNIVAAACLLVVLIAPGAKADSIRLPLHGYYHPGQWMPVEWEIASPATLIFAASNGIAPSMSSAASHGVAPLLLSDPPQEISWHTAETSGRIDITALHPLSDNQKLIGTDITDTQDESILQQVFPGQAVVPVRLDMANPLPGPPMAYQTLDAVVLTDQTYARLTFQKQSLLHAFGVTFAVTANAPPDDHFIWQHTHSLWIARADAPSPPMFSADAYNPTQGWTPGRSAEYRRRIILLAALVCIITASLSLWRSKWMPPAQVALALVLIFSLVMWNRRQSPVMRAGGDVYLMNDSQTPIVDRWTYLQSPADADFQLPVDGLTRAVFYSVEQRDWTQLRLTCDSTGNPLTLSGHLRAQWPLAILARQTADHVPNATSPIKSPLQTLAAQSVYPGYRFSATRSPPTSDANAWPSIILRRPH